MLPLDEFGVAEIDAVVLVPPQPLGSVQVYVVALLTGVTLYICAMPGHTETGPLIDAADPGAAADVTASVLGVDVPQVFIAVTDIVPPAAIGVTKMLFVLLVPTHPAGNVQLYEVAPLTGAVLYVCDTPLHTAVEPLIGLGCVGAAPELTERVLAAEVRPHALVAVTDTVPPVAFGVAEIEFVVLVPVHPGGSAQVYDVAPATAGTV
jgi:hypothetical protein